MKAAEDGRQILHCTASSTVEDLHGDTMTDECVRDMASQAKSKAMTIFLNHRYNVPEDVFGVTTDSAVTSRAQEKDGVPVWDMDLDIDLAGTNPRVPQTYSLIATDKVKLGVSIGAMIEEYDFKDKEAGFWGGLIIKKVNLLEASIVGIPANQRSWVQNAVRAVKAAIKTSASEDDMDEKNEQPPVTLEASRAALQAGAAPTNEPKTAESTPPATPETPDPQAKPEASTEVTPTPEATGTGDGSAAAESSGEPSAQAQPTETASATATAKSAPLSSEGASLIEATATALEAAVNDLRTKDAEIASLNGQVKQLTGRLAAAEKVAEAASELIERMATTPLGRKTVIRESVSDFKDVLTRVYGPEIAAAVTTETP